VITYDFFFSSRRRHTRFSRDWSSDVCSSDLRTVGGELTEERLGALANSLGDDGARILKNVRGVLPRSRGQEPARVGERDKGRERSEERRVGKECSRRWSQGHEQSNVERLRMR